MVDFYLTITECIMNIQFVGSLIKKGEQMRKTVISLLVVGTLFTTVVIATADSQNLQVGVQKEVQPSVYTEPNQIDQKNHAMQMPNQVPNEVILNDIQTMLRSSYRKYTIKIHIIDGIVTLSGAVNSADDKQNIEEMVKRIRGVREINNQLEVSPSYK